MQSFLCEVTVMLTLSDFKKGINPHGIPYANMTKGKAVVVDIPIDHSGTYAEVEGVISENLWVGSPRTVYSQIKLTKQNTMIDVISLGSGLYAVYPEKIKRLP